MSQTLPALIEFDRLTSGEIVGSPAQRLYAIYNHSGPDASRGLNAQGQPCPQWADLSDAERAKWEGVFQAIANDDLLLVAEHLEARLAAAAQTSADPTPGNGPIALALNVAKTQVGLAAGAILRAQKDGGAVGSG